MRRRFVTRRVPGFVWVQGGVTRSFRWRWAQPMYQGIVTRYQFGPVWIATMRKP